MRKSKDKSNPKEKMLTSAAALLSEKGFEGSSFSAVIEHSGAPRGSIYHHFPGGKEEMVSQAVALVGERMVNFLRSYPPDASQASPKDFVMAFISIWRRVLLSSECKAGCAVAAVALESSNQKDLSLQAARVFEAWLNEVGHTLQRLGMTATDAQEFSLLLIASLEGALLWSRAERTPKTLDALEQTLLKLLAA